VWQNKCQGLAERVKEALKDVPLPPGGSYKIANLLKSGALTGGSLLCVVGVVSLSADLHQWLVKAGDSNLAAVLAVNAYSA
jgi:hypothetical protein